MAFMYLSSFILSFKFILLSFYLMIALPVFALISLIVERSVSKNLITEKTTLIIHMINLSLSMLVPCTVVLLRPPSPFSGIILLMASMITFLKLTSFVMANRQFRLDLKNKKENENFKEKGIYL